LEVTVRVRPRNSLQPLAASNALADTPITQRRYLTREEYADQHGADPQDLAAVEEFAKAHGLKVVDSSVPRRSVIMSGTVEEFNKAFDTYLEQYQTPDGSYRGRKGPVKVPATLKDVVEGVFGLDDRPQAKPHFTFRNAAQGIQAHTVASSFTPPQLAKLYNFPANLDGDGQCIAIIELGGAFRTADLQAYFTRLGLPVPNVKAVLVDHAHMHPDDSDGEVMLDIEVAAAIAPKARIVVYFAPNTSQGFLDAITKAIHDDQNTPDVISISWGNPEKTWTQQALEQFDQAFQVAASLGVTICCASGDAGSGDENPDRGVAPDGLAHVDFPSSSPFALACGGTKLVASNGSITGETVWNEDPLRSATGGGVSAVFALPSYQNNAQVPVSVNPGGKPGRGVPDVAGDADPATGYQVRVDGQDTVIGGTSAVAPLLAGLVALLNQGLGHPVGFLNPLLYGSLAGSPAIRDIVQGDNGAYQAGQGWDACTGLGVPDGTQLLQALGG
jgi:kumamolisin